MSVDPRTARELYDATASGWVRTQPLSLSDFTGRPPTLALLEPVALRRILDLGCGEGYCARELRRRGAEVVGVDVSSAMIGAARAEEAQRPLGIEYQEGSALDLGRFDDAAFDSVVAVFLFNYLGVADTRACMAEVARVLRPGGRFVFAVPHPAFPFLCRKQPPFYFDTGGGGYQESRDRRFAGRIWKRDGTSLEVQAVHKTIGDYFDALASAGFRSMPTVRELSVTPEIRAVDPDFFAPLGDTPLHLAIALQR